MIFAIFLKMAIPIMTILVKMRLENEKLEISRNSPYRQSRDVGILKFEKKTDKAFKKDHQNHQVMSIASTQPSYYAVIHSLQRLSLFRNGTKSL